MNRQNDSSGVSHSNWEPPYPFDRDHWQAIVAAMGLSPQHAKIVKLVMDDLSTKEIAVAMNIGEGTVKEHLKRISQRTDTRGRVQLIVHVLTITYQLLSGK